MILELQKALLAYLRGRAELTPWLGSPARVHDQPPETVAYPYVGFGRWSAQPIGGVGPDVIEHTLNLMCVSRFGGTEEAKGLAEALRGVLDAAELTLDGGRLVSVRVSFVDVFRASDLRTVYGLVRVRAVTES